MSPLRWAAESLVLLADVIERAQAALEAEREAKGKARWEAEAPLRAALQAQAGWVEQWSQTTPEGKAWRAHLDAAPTLTAYTLLMEEATAVYAAWQQAHPDAARRLVEDATFSLDEIDLLLPDTPGANE